MTLQLTNWQTAKGWMFPNWLTISPIDVWRNGCFRTGSQISQSQNDRTLMKQWSVSHLTENSWQDLLFNTSSRSINHGWNSFSGSMLSAVRQGNKTTDRDLIVQYWPGHRRSITIGTVSVGQNQYITTSLPALRPVQRTAVWQSTHKSTPSLLIHKSSSSFLIHKSTPSVLIHKSSPF